MKLAAGGTAVLEAARGVPPYGFFLANGRQEMLLPYSGEGNRIVDAIVYNTLQNRLLCHL